MSIEDQTLLDRSSAIALHSFLVAMDDLVARTNRPAKKISKRRWKKKKQKHQKTQSTDSSSITLNLLTKNFPALKKSLTAFDLWENRDNKDSMQQLQAIANHLALGLDQQALSLANKEDQQRKKYKKQVTLFEQININSTNTDESAITSANYRYDLKPLSPRSIFPVLARQCESNKAHQINKEYCSLWKAFSDDLPRIPKAHQSNLGLWLDHFDTLWGTYAHNIPLHRQDKINEGISLYDHSKTTAALATALWRYHRHDKAVPKFKQEWDTKKFLLIQGDFFGIQAFIFANGGESNKKAAKLLRGRSFYVSLLMECAALRILDTLRLPATSQVINVAGKFIIIAPNTATTVTHLKKVQQQFDDWFLEQSWGQSGIGLAWQDASCSDFSRDRYPDLIKGLYQKLEVSKYQRLNLCGNKADTVAIFKDYLDRFDQEKGVCQIDGRSPAIAKQDDIWVGALARDQIDCGRFIVNERLERLVISREVLDRQKGLGLDIFGYCISFIGHKSKSGEFKQLVRKDNLLRLWDFSLPTSETATLWNGYARRNINAFVPLFNDQSLNEQQQGKYEHCDEDEFGLGRVKSFSHLACEDKQFDANHWRGNSALMALKGDIDNLGLMFRRGLKGNNFSKMAALSRQINAFFTIYLPWLCQSNEENQCFRNTYTVFAGGDDFFLIGSWHSQIRLARYLRTAFQRYVAHNPQIHFSVGLSMYKAGVPITYLAEEAEKALDKAKKDNPKGEATPPKDRVNCFNISVSWDEFINLEEGEQMLDHFKQEYSLSTGYLYGLLNLVDMKERVQEDPSQSIWHSYFSYRTYRLLEQNKRINENQRRSQYLQLAKEISTKGIEQYGKKYKVALFTHLYKHRY